MGRRGWHKGRKWTYLCAPIPSDLAIKQEFIDGRVLEALFSVPVSRKRN